MITVAYVISNESDRFAWFAYNSEEEHLLNSAIGLYFDGDVEIELMDPSEALDEYSQEDVPTTVPYGTVDRFYYGS